MRTKEQKATAKRAWRARNPKKALAATQKWRLSHPEKVAGCARRAKYGLLPEEFEAIKASQEGACKLCKKLFVKPPCVDHDHVTGKVRALLCFHCNTGFGSFFENPTVLMEAVKYAVRHRKPDA